MGWFSSRTGHARICASLESFCCEFDKHPQVSLQGLKLMATSREVM